MDLCKSSVFTVNIAERVIPVSVLLLPWLHWFLWYYVILSSFQTLFLIVTLYFLSDYMLFLLSY